jgi:hypothetical protein
MSLYVRLAIHHSEPGILLRELSRLLACRGDLMYVDWLLEFYLATLLYQY